MDKSFVLDKIYFFLDKFILSRTNLILFQTKKYFVQADGQGINFFPWIHIWPQNRENIIFLLSKNDPEVCILYLENCHCASKVLCFKTIFYCFPIWVFQWWIIFLFFQKINIWVKGYFRREKKSLHAKNQHLTFKIICFRTISYCLQHSVFSMMFHIFIFSKNRYLS